MGQRQQLMSEIVAAMRCPTMGDLVRSGTLRRTVPGTYNPATQAAAVTVTATPCRVLWGTAASTPMANLSLTIKPGDVPAWVLSDVAGFEPQIADTLEIDYQTYSVVNASDATAGAGALYLVVLR